MLRAYTLAREPFGDPGRLISRAPFADLRRAGDILTLEILRDEKCLKRVSLPAARLAPGPLRMTASKMAGSMRFEVGDLPTVEFQDVYAAPTGDNGVFAVCQPARVRLAALRGERQSLPRKPSPLERGDSLYSLGDYGAALATYRDQLRSFADAPTRQQARYKEALCLLALGRDQQAEEILESLSRESGDEWPALAICQLWLRRTRQQRFDEGEAIFQEVSTRYRLEDLARRIPTELIDQLLEAYLVQTRSLSIYRHNPRLVLQSERALAIGELFQDPVMIDVAARTLIRAYRIAGQERQALEFTERMMRDRPYFHWAVGSDYCWMLRLAGRPLDALAESDHQAMRAKPPARPGGEWTLERVRVLAALNRWDDAERTLDELFRDAGSPAQMGYCYPSACALQGFLRERRGDAPGALAVWKEGLRCDWKDRGFGLMCLQGAILASLTGDVSEADAKALLNQVALGGEGSQAGVLTSEVFRSFVRPELVTSVIRNMFRTPRGRQYARQITFREIPFAECVRAPVLLAVSEVLRQGAMPENLSDEQETILWGVVEEGYRAVFQAGTLDKSHILQFGFAWKGMTNYLGWAGVAPRLDPRFRGPLAYVMGHRYLRLQRPQDAVMLFRTARDDAPAISPLRQLAQAECDRLALSANKPPDGRPAAH